MLLPLPDTWILDPKNANGAQENTYNYQVYEPAHWTQNEVIICICNW